MIDPPILPTRILPKILQLGFSLDMERWLNPHSIANHIITENFKTQI